MQKSSERVKWIALRNRRNKEQKEVKANKKKKNKEGPKMTMEVEKQTNK